MIAGEGPPGAIRPVHARREPDDEQAVASAAEGGDRAAVIVRVMFPDLIEEVRKARAEPANRIEGCARHAEPEALSVP